jgi:carboxyl-terminal processing protease
MNIQRFFLSAMLATASLMAVGAGKQTDATSQTMTAERKVAFAERLIESYYIDDVDSDKLAEEAIVAMLKTLDPHSSYTDPEATKAMTTPLDGNFSGIGIQFNMINDTLYVIQPTAGGPSEKVGILPGDRIISANSTAISGAGKTNAEIMKLLRGTKGTTVDVAVLRKGVAKPINFRIVRDDIPVNSVDAAFMADATTGYIRLTRFAETSDKEITEAMKKLRKLGMKNLILDLEDNGGGYLSAATAIAGHFLRKGDSVTYTESPKLGTTFYDVKADGDFLSGRIVLMVNQYSASAAEILSGSIQDNDRGLIVGRRTFGKGLVQRPFPFPDGSMVKLTVSRYHTPSGRVIQKPYTKGKADDYRMDIANRYDNGEFLSSEKISFPDSLKFHTLKNARTVYGGGGIMPDLFVPIDTVPYTDYYRDLVAKGVLNKTALNYVDNNRSTLKSTYPTVETFIAGFRVPDALVQKVVSQGKTDGVQPNTKQLERSRSLITIILKGLIARDIFDSESYYRVVNPQLNPIYKAALDLINDSAQYQRLLSGANTNR